MIGLIVMTLYALGLFIFSDYSWQSIYFHSTSFLFRWYFIWSVLLIVVLSILAFCTSSLFALWSYVYRSGEFLLGLIGVTTSSVYSLVWFTVKRLMLILGAYYLHQALVFDPDKIPIHHWDKDSFLFGMALLLIVIFFLTKKPGSNFKPRKNTRSKGDGLEPTTATY